MTHSFPVTVYYEDTDMGGIVYYANYLKFIERARSTWVSDKGLDQLAMKDAGCVFVVRRVEADYFAPARLGDQLEVHTSVNIRTPVKCILQQDIWCEGKRLFSAIVTIVLMNKFGKPIRIPVEIF